MEREYHEWYSPALNRRMELLTFGKRGARVMMFPTRKGRFYEYEDEGIIAALRRHVEAGWLRLCCLDSIDSEALYNGSIPPEERILRHENYERYVLDEVLPFFTNGDESGSLVSFGCSLGAYHAVNIAMRHPAKFTKVVGLSGRYDLTASVEDFDDLMSGFRGGSVYFHQPNQFLPNLGEPILLTALRKLDITLVIGERDPFYDSNRTLSETLFEKGVWHLFRVWPGRAHRWTAWQEMVQVYL